MTAAATAFTPTASLFGGALIGVASVLLMLTLGRIMGATGILAGAVDPAHPGDRAWRIAVLAGMISGPLAYRLLTGGFPAMDFPVPLPAIAFGGLVVGVGVTLGGGCTSGHGVCGLARLSPRSAVATAVFMASTFVTVYVVRHVIGA